MTHAELVERGKRVRSRLPAASQVRMCGNSVPPQFYAALAPANVPELVRRPEGGLLKTGTKLTNVASTGASV